MKKPIAAILGCGPSGLLAAHACSMYDVPFVVFSRAVQSRLGGAQYSHIPIPGIHDDSPETTLHYRVVGDPEIYQRKVYGDNPVPFVSFEHVYEGKAVSAWSLPKMYDALWERYKAGIVDISIEPIRAELLAQDEFFGLVFSSIPAPAICKSSIDPSINHWFREQPIRIYNEALIASLEDDTIYYDGTEDHSWYRMSRIFGVASTEWGAGSPIPPLNGLRTINKPIGTNCDCHPEIIRVGRFGTWTKGVLTFHAYNRVVERLAQIGMADAM